MGKKPRTEAEKEAKRLRARARRHGKRRDEAIQKLYKPVEEWDPEELARGRPRDKNGGFSGRTPGFITRAVHEEAIRRFTEITRADMRALVPEAMAVLRKILESEEKDDKGRPVVPAGVKLDAIKWTIEQLVGKPTQKMDVDISVRLQAVLAGAMVNVGEDGQATPAIDATYREIEDLPELPRGSED